MVDALVLVCPGLGGFRFEDKANKFDAIIESAQDGNYERATELWLANPYMSLAMENPVLREKLRLLARDNLRAWLKINPLLIRRSRPPVVERLREIRAPTLVVGGERDVSDIHKIVAKLVAEIPGARKEMLPDAGHLVPMEKPEEFNRLVLEFIQQRNGN
jgi:pimeloyl-ACP methyl ester carboxylesterase